MLELLVATLLVTGLPSGQSTAQPHGWLQPQDISPPRATRGDFERLTGHFTAGSATWRQDNREPGDDGPTAWLRRHSASGDLSTAEVVAVFADGRCQPVTTIEYRFSPEEGTIATASRLASGLSFTGSMEAIGGGRFRTISEGALPDGTQLKMRDTTDLSRPGIATSAAERWVEGAWVPLDGAEWRQVPASAWCDAR